MRPAGGVVLVAGKALSAMPSPLMRRCMLLLAALPAWMRRTRAACRPLSLNLPARLPACPAAGAIGYQDRSKGSKCVVLKTSTRQTVFLPVAGLVDPNKLKPADLVRHGCHGSGGDGVFMCGSGGVCGWVGGGGGGCCCRARVAAGSWAWQRLPRPRREGRMRWLSSQSHP